MFSITKSTISSALDKSRTTPLPLMECISKETAATSPDELYAALAAWFGLPFFKNCDGKVDGPLFRESAPEVFSNGRFFPLASAVETDDVYVVTADPFDLDGVAKASAALQTPCRMALTTPGHMEHLRAKFCADTTAFQNSAGRLWREYEEQMGTASDDDVLSIDEMRKRTEAEPVVKMVSLIFDEALKVRASDIHVEPGEHEAVIRFRVDGLLNHFMKLSRTLYGPLTSRIKILAELDIAEKRVPQDGRIRYVYGSKQYDFRVSTLPTHFGEKTVLRILKHDQSLLEIEHLGLTGVELGHITEIIEKPQGMVFVTGPTGSGKSSTLFAALNRIKGRAINITTIENPIEYKLDGINQVQINEKAGVTFASCLRSVLRQDPDVILIGEIRDKETADIAIQASQTGHLVFSTLHTNDSISAITRLKDLGIASYLVASSLLAIVAQRLVRVLCPHCKIQGDVPPEVLRRWDRVLRDTPMPDSFRPVGCDACSGLGYRDRTALFEVVVVDEHFRELIADNVSETKLRQLFKEQGGRTLVQNGIEKIAQGITTPEEVLRVVVVEDM